MGDQFVLFNHRGEVPRKRRQAMSEPVCTGDLPSAARDAAGRAAAALAVSRYLVPDTSIVEALARSYVDAAWPRAVAEEWTWAKLLDEVAGELRRSRLKSKGGTMEVRRGVRS